MRALSANRWKMILGGCLAALLLVGGTFAIRNDKGDGSGRAEQPEPSTSVTTSAVTSLEPATTSMTTAPVAASGAEAPPVTEMAVEEATTTVVVDPRSTEAVAVAEVAATPTPATAEPVDTGPSPAPADPDESELPETIDSTPTPEGAEPGVPIGDEDFTPEELEANDAAVAAAQEAEDAAQRERQKGEESIIAEIEGG